MGVAQHKLSPPLPEQLEAELPTIEELAPEFPAMSLVKLQIEIERALQGFVSTQSVSAVRPQSIGLVLQDLKRRGQAPASTDRFLEALRGMNEAAHGFDVDPDSAAQVVRIGKELLAELGALHGDSP